MRLHPDAARILDKYHRRRCRQVSNRDQAHLVIALGIRIAQHRENMPWIAAPLGQDFRERWRGFGKRFFIAIGQPGHQCFTLRIMLADHASFVDDDKAVLHVTNDEFIDLRQIGQVYAACFGNLFRAVCIFGKRKSQAGDDKVTTGKQSALEEISPR